MIFTVLMNLEPHFFILTGDKETWLRSFNKNLWGFTEKTKGSWNTSQVNDLVAFYVTAPIKKIIGFGIIRKKFIDSELFWNDEILFKKSIWPYRFEFEPIHIEDDWENGISVPAGIMLNVGRKVIDKLIFSNLIREADSKWNTKMNGIEKKAAKIQTIHSKN